MLGMRLGLAALAAGCLGASTLRAADASRFHDRRPSVDLSDGGVPSGYAYGGYGNGPRPGWTDGRYGPPGYGPGYGYIPPGHPDAGFDLGR